VSKYQKVLVYGTGYQNLIDALWQIAGESGWTMQYPDSRQHDLAFRVKIYDRRGNAIDLKGSLPSLEELERNSSKVTVRKVSGYQPEQTDESSSSQSQQGNTGGSYGDWGNVSS